MSKIVHRIDGSASHHGSFIRELSDQVIDQLHATKVVTRDLASTPVPQIDENGLAASFTPADARTPAQKEALILPDTLIEDVMEADTLVIGVPIYNFGDPAAVKAWSDHACRAGKAFQYSKEGPKGLLHGKRALLFMVPSRTEIGSEIDFAINYMQHVLSFIGIANVDGVAANKTVGNADVAMTETRSQIEALAA